MSRIDRKTALRRAAAPSVDFSLMPDAGAVQALLDAANRTPRASERRPPAAPSSSPTLIPDGEGPVPLDADVPARFRMRPRPAGHATLQPHDAPTAAALDRAAASSESAAAEVPVLSSEPEDADRDAALAFVRAHRDGHRPRSARYERHSQPPSTSNAPADPASSRRIRPTGLPTLNHFGRLPGLDLDLDDDEALPADVPAFEPAPRGTHRAASTLEPRGDAGVTLTPSGDEVAFWESSEAHLPPPAPAHALASDDDETLGEDIDPELDAWMASRWRRRVLSGLGVAATMLLLLAAAAGGVAVMAQPGLLQGLEDAPVEAPAPPPPPRPVR